jgi:BirA family biotin operon repressor/biotin-[acetyl-CoA-carboxylase] ligase
MSNIKHPAILIDLGHVGENGLPLNPDPWFQEQLELCREWGIKLNISSGRVSLQFDHEQLVPYWIQKETAAIAWNWLRVNGFFRIDSTNREATELARLGTPSGTLVYSEEQTAGKGRKGREWFSPRGSGLYFSLVLRPKQPREIWPILTHVASIALVDTLRELSDRKSIPVRLDLDIKWPNDVLLSGRKCAGILLEMVPGENEGHAAVVGIGIDVHEGSVPESLRSEAVSIDEMAMTQVPRRQLLVRFLQNFQTSYMTFERGNHRELLEKWKSLSSMWDGAPIWIMEGKTRRAAVACGINDIGALLVRTPEGAIETLMAADISVRRDI